MTTLYACAYVRLGGRRVLADELLGDATLRARADLRGNPAGGIEVGNDGDYVLIDDVTGFVCDEMLLPGADMLRAGQAVVYQSKLSRDSIAITIDDGVAVLDDGAGGHVEAPVEEFAAALETGAAQYRTLLAAGA